MQFRFAKTFMPTPLLTGLLLAIPAILQAASVYSSEDEFATYLRPGYYFVDFESLVRGDQGSTNISLSGGTPAFTFNISTVTGLNNNLYVPSGTLPSGKAVSTTVDSTDLLLTFTSGNVTAIGANFFLTDIAENQIGGSLDAILSDGTSLGFSSPSSGAVEFRGFTVEASNPIASLRIHTDSEYLTLDNLYVGSVGATNLTRATLSVRPVNATQVQISWPVSAAGDVLRAKSDLSGDSWTDVVEIDAPSDGFHRVLVNTSGGMRFFQLQRP